MLRFVDYMESRSENNIVVRGEKDGWCLGEWCTPQKVELTESYVNTCLYLEQLKTLKNIAEILGDFALAGDIENKISIKQTAVKTAFFKNEIWDCGKQGAPLFAWAAGIITLDEIIPFLEEYKGKSLDVGIFGLPILIKALFNADMGDTVIDLLTKDDGVSFGSMIINKGLTTLSETLMGGGSRNHPMFGGFVSTLIENMLGINLTRDTAGFTGDWRIAKSTDCGGRIFTPNGYIDI